MFLLQIHLGNAAMRRPSHVAAAVEKIAKKIREGQDGGKVMDANGNSVGEWSLGLPDEDEEGQEE